MCITGMVEVFIFEDISPGKVISEEYNETYSAKSLEDRTNIFQAINNILISAKHPLLHG